LVLATGDGAGVVTEGAVSITALRDSELFLLDLGDCARCRMSRGGFTKPAAKSERISFAAEPAHTP
jgi:hypothetical protein